MSDEETVREALQPVQDPELGLSLLDLGLVYGIRISSTVNGTHCEVDLTLTSPGCPAAPEIMAAVHRAALGADGIDSAHVNLVWTPRWDPRIHANEDARFEMGIFD